MKLFIYGFPGEYGGAASELYHQIRLWKEMGMNLVIIPSHAYARIEPLYEIVTKELNIQVLKCNQFDTITRDDAIINFCSKEFLEQLPTIKQFTNRTIFVNCMTWLHEGEKQQHELGNIAFSLYQREAVRAKHTFELRRKHGSKAEFLPFTPYFYRKDFKFKVNEGRERFSIGRISRADADKFSKHTLGIYEYILSPKLKEAHFLGWDEKLVAKIGKPMDWVNTYENQHTLPVLDFYDKIDIIVQPMDTMENWPRIGFEAMFSGKPLIVDNRGGWRSMIHHKQTGFLCNRVQDFSYYASHLAYNPDVLLQIAFNARDRAEQLAGSDVSMDSWRKVFEKVFNLNSILS